MADILMDEQVSALDNNLCELGTVTSGTAKALIATLRHVQAENEQWAQASNNQTQIIKSLYEENARLREALVRISNSDDEWYFGKTSMRAVARQALSTEGETTSNG